MIARLPSIGLAFVLTSCALSHTRTDEDDAGADVAAVPAPLVGDWTFAAPICDSFNRLVWVTLCPDGTAWLSDFQDHPPDSQTFPREVTPIDDRSVHFEPIAAGNAFESTALEWDAESDRLVWVERIGTPFACGAIDSHGERGRPDPRHTTLPLPSHPCP